ncbi:substrate-binding domain-containing protein [Microbacterium sp.]|uniref:substrate-binding domain-containing protein n=1 Tax=Microbacterium sp. TaxID=51671 RepID=UPI003A937427
MIWARRIRGLHQALATRGLTLDDELIKTGPSTPEFAARAVAELLDAQTAPTAIYLSTAPLSLGGAHELSARGLSRPNDLSVIVAGSAPWYDAWSNGGLTSVTLPMRDLVHAAAEFIRRDNRNDDTPTFWQREFEVIQRGSTASARLSSELARVIETVARAVMVDAWSTTIASEVVPEYLDMEGDEPSAWKRCRSRYRSQSATPRSISSPSAAPSQARHSRSDQPSVSSNVAIEIRVEIRHGNNRSDVVSNAVDCDESVNFGSSGARTS